MKIVLSVEKRKEENCVFVLHNNEQLKLSSAFCHHLQMHYTQALGYKTVNLGIDCFSLSICSHKFQRYKRNMWRLSGCTASAMLLQEFDWCQESLHIV